MIYDVFAVVGIFGKPNSSTKIPSLLRMLSAPGSYGNKQQMWSQMKFTKIVFLLFKMCFTNAGAAGAFTTSSK